MNKCLSDDLRGVLMVGVQELKADTEKFKKEIQGYLDDAENKRGVYEDISESDQAWHVKQFEDTQENNVTMLKNCEQALEWLNSIPEC